jgi:uncharacterized protein YndB with AHSA1/START domain
MQHNVRLAAELAAPPADVYAMYLDPEMHADIIGGAVTVVAREGSAFLAFEGTLSGRILHLMPGKRIVQTWRSNEFRKEDPDSILILSFTPHGRKGTLVDLQHIDVPEQDYAGISQGWELYYFAPWREYLKKRNGKKRPAKPARMG